MSNQIVFARQIHLFLLQLSRRDNQYLAETKFQTRRSNLWQNGNAPYHWDGVCRTVAFDRGALGIAIGIGQCGCKKGRGLAGEHRLQFGCQHLLGDRAGTRGGRIQIRKHLGREHTLGNAARRDARIEGIGNGGKGTVRGKLLKGGHSIAKPYAEMNVRMGTENGRIDGAHSGNRGVPQQDGIVSAIYR